MSDKNETTQLMNFSEKIRNSHAEKGDYSTDEL
jgi:hypothetical protein